MEDALVLRPSADVLAHLVPVVLVEFQALEQQQRFLFGPLARRLVLQHGALAAVLVEFQAKVALGFVDAASRRRRHLESVSTCSSVTALVLERFPRVALTFLSRSMSVLAADGWAVRGGLTGCRPDGVSDRMWKCDVGGGPTGIGRESPSTCGQS